MRQRRPDGCTQEVWEKAAWALEGDEDEAVHWDALQKDLPKITKENFVYELRCDCVAAANIGVCAHKLVVANHLGVYPLQVQAGEMTGNNRSAKAKGPASRATGALTKQPETPKKSQGKSPKGKGGGKSGAKGKSGGGKAKGGGKPAAVPAAGPKKRQRGDTAAKPTQPPGKKATH